MMVSGWFPGKSDNFSDQKRWTFPAGSARRNGSVEVESGDREILKGWFQLSVLVGGFAQVMAGSTRMTSKKLYAEYLMAIRSLF